MRRAASVLGTALILAGCAGPRATLAPLSGPAIGAPLIAECGPYARALSGLRLYGDAADWWSEAAGRYRRAHTPIPGAVLVFERSGRLPHGHVAVVSRVLDARRITVDQANWVHHHVGRGDPVVDVSGANDWSRVRIWWAQAGVMGATIYDTDGFISAF